MLGFREYLLELTGKGKLKTITKANLLRMYAQRGKNLRKTNTPTVTKKSNVLTSNQRRKIKLKPIKKGQPHLDAAEIQIMNSYINLKDKKRNNPYIDTPFQTYRGLKSRSCGAEFEKLTKDYLTKRFPFVNFLDKPTPRKGHKKTECDLVLDGRYGPIKVEVKGSSAWVNPKTGQLTHYKWQTIRLWEDYDIMIFMGMDPRGVNWWYTTKQELLDAHLETQHGGKGIRGLKTTKHFDAPYNNPTEKYPFMHILDEKGMRNILRYKGM